MGKKAAQMSESVKQSYLCWTNGLPAPPTRLLSEACRGTFDRADKVYEGIKKVMDFRAREGWFDRKSV